MEDLIVRLQDAVLDRLQGPMKFRFLLQPLVAAFFAVRAGLADARNGRPLFFWALLTNRESRVAMMKDGWKDISKVFTIAVIMDLIYQYIVLHHLYPLRALLVAAVLCIFPYLVIRGTVNRIARRKKS